MKVTGLCGANWGVASLGLFLSACATAPVAPSGTAEVAAEGALQPGSVIYWVEGGAGSDMRWSNQVIAVGEDFLILHDADMDEFVEMEGSGSAYGVEFSAIAYWTCDEPMPSRDLRERIAGLHQAEQGDVLESDAVRIAVGEESAVQIAGLGNTPAREYVVDWKSTPTRSEIVRSATSPQLVVYSDWSDADPARVTRVSTGTEDADALIAEHLGRMGNCAALLANN